MTGKPISRSDFVDTITWIDKDMERDLLPSMIPEAYRKIVDIVGVPNFLMLCDAWGSRGHYFPTLDYVSKQGKGIVSLSALPADERAVVRAIGTKSYMDLLETFGGSVVYIPQRQSVLRPVRNAKIQQDYRSGLISVSKIADKYGLTCSTINSICKGLQRERKQQ